MTKAASSIVSTGIAITSHRFAQEELLQALLGYWNLSPDIQLKVEKLYKSVGVEHRHLALSPEQYIALDTFDKRNTAFFDVAVDLGTRATQTALDQIGISAQDIGFLGYTSVTGISVPSLDARLLNLLPFSPQTKRLPIFGLGCVGGAAVIARAHDYLVGHPDEFALVLSVELCSLTLQRDDLSVASLVGAALFGDGAGAVILAGEKAAARHGFMKGPRIIDTQSAFLPGTEYVMGWDIGSHGFKIVLSPDVPKISSEALPPEVKKFLMKHSLTPKDINWWIAHPGGPKVIDAIENSLELKPHSLDVSRQCLKEVGNLSSASVIWVLNQTLKNPAIKAGDKGILMAMGPGFCIEMVLLQW